MLEGARRMIAFDKVIDVKVFMNAFIMKKGYGFPSKFDCIDIIELPTKEFDKQIFTYKKW